MNFTPLLGWYPTECSPGCPEAVRLSCLADGNRHYDQPFVSMGTVASNPSGWLFPPMQFAHPCADQPSTECSGLGGTFCTSQKLPFCAFHSSVLWTPAAWASSDSQFHLNSERPWAASQSSLHRGLETLSRQQAGAIAGLTLFVSGITVLNCLMSHV